MLKYRTLKSFEAKQKKPWPGARPDLVHRLSENFSHLLSFTGWLDEPQSTKVGFLRIYIHGLHCYQLLPWFPVDFFLRKEPRSWNMDTCEFLILFASKTPHTKKPSFGSSWPSTLYSMATNSRYPPSKFKMFFPLELQYSQYSQAFPSKKKSIHSSQIWQPSIAAGVKRPAPAQGGPVSIMPAKGGGGYTAVARWLADSCVEWKLCFF